MNGKKDNIDLFESICMEEIYSLNAKSPMDEIAVMR